MDSPLTSSTTACAQNVFWEYWTASSGGFNAADDIRAYRPALRRWLDLSCGARDPVVCRGDAGAEVRMPAHALADYSPEAADAYAADHTVSGGYRPFRVLLSCRCSSEALVVSEPIRSVRALAESAPLT
jgi:hypothetical protein